MEIIITLIAVALLVYLKNRNTALSDQLEEFKASIKKLESRITKLELFHIKSEYEKESEFHKETVKKDISEVKVPDSATIAKEEVIEEKIIEEVKEEVVEESSSLAFLVTEEDDTDESPDELVEAAEKSSVVNGEEHTEESTVIKEEANPTEIPVRPEVSEPSRAKVYAHSSAPRPFKPKAPVVEEVKSEFWMKVEKQFVENWTGILGSVIMVIGVGFLGIYTALKISALGRFLLISGFATLLGAMFFYLHKKPSWLKLALWLRSSAGAIFLFACVGSITIPGLKWLETESTQILVLSLGVLLNLFLGYVGKNQGLASLHVLLSLVGVWTIPSTPTSLIIGGIVTLFGVALSYRENWEYHLLLTVSSFFAFHLLYWFSLNHIISNSDRIYGIATILCVGVAVALVHYREVYSKKSFERIPFLVHLINWFFFGFSLYLYSSGSKMTTFVLTAGAIAAFVLARRAKKLEISWLFLTDTLIAQVIAMIALITLARWQIDQSIIVASIFLEILLFLVIAKKENDLLLYKIGSVVLNCVGIYLVFYSIFTFNRLSELLLYEHATSILVSALFGTVFIYFSNKKNTLDLSGLFRALNYDMDEKTKHPVLSILVGVFFVSYYVHLIDYKWSIYTVLTILSVILYLRNKLQSVEFTFISAIFLMGAHIVNWVALNETRNESASQLLIVGLPLLTISALSIKFSYVEWASKHLKWIGVYLFSIQLILLTYYVYHPISVAAVSCAWLGLSLLAILIVKFISKKSDQFHQIDRNILHVGLVLIGLFLVRHLVVNLNSEELWGPIKARIWVEIMAFSVFLVWALTKNTENTPYKSWKYLHPLFVELILIFSFASLTLELNYQYLGFTWLGMAGITFALANWKHESIARISLYSFAFFLMSLVQEVYIYYRVHMDSGSASAFPTQQFILSSVFIVFSLTYLFIFYKRAKLIGINCPSVLSDLSSVAELLHRSAAFIGVYFFGIFIMLISYFMFVSTSEIIPGVIWLLLAALVATFSSKKQNNIPYVDRYKLHIIYLFLISFFIRHVLVHIQIESHVGIFKLRLLIELLAIGVVTYCATMKKPENSTYKSWDYLHPLLIEFLIIFSIFTIALEVDAIWQPIIWVSISFIFAFIGKSKFEKLSRLLFYSLILYWVAALQTAFVTSTYVVPSNEAWAQPWIYGSLSLVFQFAFLLYFYLRCSFEKIVLPRSLLFLTEVIEKVEKSRNTFVFYPLIICTAVFFFWTFDKSVLTLLWVIECLAIFMISLVLKKQHFRYVALGALAICIVRLIFFDLAQSSTLTRALVFLSVGIIMLVMNSLYNKFKNRFE